MSGALPSPPVPAPAPARVQLKKGRRPRTPYDLQWAALTAPSAKKQRKLSQAEGSTRPKKRRTPTDLENGNGRNLNEVNPDDLLPPQPSKEATKRAGLVPCPEPFCWQVCTSEKRLAQHTKSGKHVFRKARRTLREKIRSAVADVFASMGQRSAPGQVSTSSSGSVFVQQQ